MPNSNLLMCMICGNLITNLSLEKSLERMYQDEIYDDKYSFGIHESLPVSLYSDPHLKCRISCARYSAVGLPSRWFTKQQFNITDGNKTAFQTIEKIKRMSYFELRSNGIYLYGLPGIGKSHLLADLCRCFTDRSTNLKSISWCNTSSILTKIRSSFGKKYEYGEMSIQEEILGKLKRKLLLLDDLGTESATDWSREILYEAINYRYDENLPLFITSNLSPQGLAEKMGDKFVSRLVEMTKPINVKGEDMRLNAIKRSNINMVVPAFSRKLEHKDIGEGDGI